ncbi:MAG TPA: HAD hydrolase family protein [Verrucomicrobiae bacterium]
MSLNIFIDVDGTLLNSNEQIDPRAKEILRQTVLKLSAEYPDSGLYLWSGAGGAYARKAAEDCGVVSFFSGFAGKPDVIVDDNPSSVFPRRAILWRGDGQWGAFQKNLFVEHSPSNHLKQTTRDIWEWVNQTDRRFASLYRPNHPVIPTPFFGEIETAEIATVAVNPSSKEFDGERGWSFPMTSEKLAVRLVNYFRQWNPPPHAWFTRLETKLRLEGHSYHFDTAHIDLSPRATRSMRSFKLQPGNFLNMVNADAGKWFLVLLRLAKRLRVIRFDEAGIISAAGKKSLAQHIQQSLPEIWREIEARKLEVSLI